MPEGVVRKGTKLGGNHPWVREWPQHFIDAGTPDDEWPNEFLGLAEPPPHDIGTTANIYAHLDTTDLETALRALNEVPR